MDEYGVGLAFNGDSVPTYESSGGGGWESWLQGIGKTVISSAVEAKYKQPYELQKMQLQQRGMYGDPYIEGVPSFNGGAGIPASWLLIGGVILAFVLVKN